MLPRWVCEGGSVILGVGVGLAVTGLSIFIAGWFGPPAWWWIIDLGGVGLGLGVGIEVGTWAAKQMGCFPRNTPEPPDDGISEVPPRRRRAVIAGPAVLLGGCLALAGGVLSQWLEQREAGSWAALAGLWLTVAALAYFFRPLARERPASLGRQ